MWLMAGLGLFRGDRKRVRPDPPRLPLKREDWRVWWFVAGVVGAVYSLWWFGLWGVIPAALVFAAGVRLSNGPRREPK